MSIAIQKPLQTFLIIQSSPIDMDLFPLKGMHTLKTFNNNVQMSPQKGWTNLDSH